MTNILEKLTDLFTQFPGIGKRQAGRFVYYLLRQEPKAVIDLADTIRSLHDNIAMCKECNRFFVADGHDTCTICTDKTRDHSQLMVVAKDVDLENIEQGDTYAGIYFVLGGTIPILEKKPEERIRIANLKDRIADIQPKEIILGLSTHPEGENTRTFIIKEITPLQKKIGFSLTNLGRGLSTGAELEYSDPETIKNALANRQ